MNDDLIDELADAIIEDTVHCTVCDAPFVLGANDPYVILNPPSPLGSRHCQQVKLCADCACDAVVEYAMAADLLPELSEKERRALDSIPPDAVTHWLAGERWDGQRWRRKDEANA